MLSSCEGDNSYRSSIALDIYTFCYRFFIILALIVICVTAGVFIYYAANPVLENASTNAVSQEVYSYRTNSGAKVTVYNRAAHQTRLKRNNNVAEETLEQRNTVIIMNETESGLGYITATVESLNVRKGASTDYDVIGSMAEGDYAIILEKDNDWYKIESGDVTGWVYSGYTITGDEAETVIQEYADAIYTVSDKGALVMAEAYKEADVIAELSEGDSITLSEDYIEDEESEWMEIVYDDDVAYVSSECVNVEYKYKYVTAVSKEVVTSSSSGGSSSSSNTTYNNSSTTASTDDTVLLAALIYCEAGANNYQGQVAVGAVVCNRVKSSSFPNSISEVIYQSGQFYPSGSSTLSNAISSGNYQYAMAAAQAALAGEDPTGGCLYFLSASVYSHSGINIGGNIFFTYW